MRVVTNDEMRGLDEETIARFEPGVVLMERAGQGIFNAIMDLIEKPEEERKNTPLRTEGSDQANILK